MSSDKRPFVIAAAISVNGHVVPIANIAGNLVERGYDVTMITGTSFRSRIEERGITFAPIIGYGDFIEEEFDTRFVERTKYEGLDKFIHDIEHVFARSMPSHYESLQIVLQKKKEEDPDRNIVVVYDWTYFGALPVLCGGPGIRPTAAIAIGTNSFTLPGPGIFPIGSGLLPDYSEEGLRKAEEVSKMAAATFERPTKVFYNILSELGAKPKAGTIFMDSLLAADRYIHTSMAEMEFPRDNMPAHISFCGGLPPQKPKSNWERPSWWEEITTNRNKATIIMTSQSTLANDLHDIAGPTLQALKDRQNTIVILNLSTPTQVVPSDIEIPPNARVGFVPFDEVLPYCDVWVLNFGFGAFLHGIINAIPMVGSGHTEDRADVAARAEYFGVAVNLRNGLVPPTPESVRKAVEEVLTNPEYKTKVTELSMKAKEYDVYGIIAKTVDEVGTGKFERLNDNVASHIKST